MGTGLKPRIVLSGVNFVEAGPLVVFQDALSELAANFAEQYEIIALVHKLDLFDTPGVRFLEFPEVKRSWLRRLRFEYRQCRALSRELRPHLWLSMHDMTPPVTAKIQAVYCHNPAPFYRPGLREALLDWKFALFTLLYRFLYGVYIGRNDFVVVQQEWLRDEFRGCYSARNIVVAHPSLRTLNLPTAMDRPSQNAPCRFFYPAFPRSFKNIELLLQAAQILEQRGFECFEVRVTIDGTENRYARSLRAAFGGLHSVRWLGVLPRNGVMAEYAEAQCLLFPSRLESWGLPISEFKETGKPMLVADLPYAHETVGSYASVQFFNPSDAQALAAAMEAFVQGRLTFSAATAQPVAAPFAKNWQELFQILLATESVL
jgi:glycosyltransferase involved in cell wall biosynthesis